MHYRHQANETGSISSDFIRVCCEDSQGHIWIGTFNGLNRLMRRVKTFVSYLRREEKSGNYIIRFGVCYVIIKVPLE